MTPENAENELRILNKMASQIEHVLNTHSGADLSIKIYQLTMEWYLKGLHVGIKYEIEQQQKKEREPKDTSMCCSLHAGGYEECHKHE